MNSQQILEEIKQEEQDQNKEAFKGALKESMKKMRQIREGLEFMEKHNANLMSAWDDGHYDPEAQSILSIEIPASKKWFK